jgi:hypothetical protein
MCTEYIEYGKAKIVEEIKEIYSLLTLIYWLVELQLMDKRIPLP